MSNYFFYERIVCSRAVWSYSVMTVGAPNSPVIGTMKENLSISARRTNIIKAF
jgi:hypothetical protein